MTRMHALYGLRIRSSAPLPCPELSEDGCAADVILTEADPGSLSRGVGLQPAHHEDDGFWETWNYDDGSARARWREHFDFSVSADGARVCWSRAAGVPDDVLNTYLLTQVLAYSLVARGEEPLHATGVQFGNSAFALLGDSGYGKSTLAAAFLRAGGRLFTDDILAVQIDGDRVRARASLPRLKLSPAALEAVLGARDAVPMNRFTSKRILRLSSQEHDWSDVELDALYVLDRNPVGGNIRIETLTGREAVLPIVQSAFQTPVLGRQRWKRQFQLASALAERLPIRRLTYPEGFGQLPDVVGSLLAHHNGRRIAA